MIRLLATLAPNLRTPQLAAKPISRNPATAAKLDDARCKEATKEDKARIASDTAVLICAIVQMNLVVILTSV